MPTGWGLAQAVVDALPYSGVAGVGTFALADASFEMTMAVAFGAVVWVVLFAMLVLFSYNRYRADGTWLPITRGILYHGIPLSP